MPAYKNLLRWQSPAFVSQYNARCNTQRIHRSLATSAQKRAAKKNGGKPPPPNAAPSLHTKPKIPARSRFSVDNTANIASGQNKSSRGVVDFIQDNLFLSLAIIFPTGMMGVALIFRKDFRAQLGFGEKDFSKTPAATPMYTSADSEEEEKILADIQKIASEGAVEEQSAPAELVRVSPLSTQSKQSLETMEKNANDTMNEGETRDLIYALGFRPHPSS